MPRFLPNASSNLAECLPSRPANGFSVPDCVYDAPTSYDSPQLLRSLVIGASCLAQRYEELSEITRGSDPVTSRLADAMFADHSDHERRLQSVLDGILAAAR